MAPTPSAAGRTEKRSAAGRAPTRRTVAVVVAVVLAVLAALVLVRVASGGGADPWEGERPGSLVVTTGGMSGIYHGYGTALGDVLAERHDVPVKVLDSGGSVENLQRLADGTAQLGFSAADAVADAVAGRGDFAEPLEVCALARVYDDFVHLVVREDSTIRTIEDLRGRAVSLGAPASGTALIARRLLDAAGVGAESMSTRPLDLGGSIDALRSGDVDAFFWSGGLRTPGIEQLADSAPIRLVPLGELVDTVRARHGSGYRYGVVPQGMYGSTAEVPTLAVPNFLVVRKDMPTPVARMLVATLFAARSQVATTAPAAGSLDRARAIFTEPADLHPGAMEYYRATKG